MAIKGSNKKKVRIQLVLLGVVAAVALGFLYFGFFRNTGSDLPPLPESSSSILPELKSSVVDSETFQSFRVWNALPIVVGETGNDNPFSP